MRQNLTGDVDGQNPRCGQAMLLEYLDGLCLEACHVPVRELDLEKDDLASIQRYLDDVPLPYATIVNALNSASWKMHTHCTFDSLYHMVHNNFLQPTHPIEQCLNLPTHKIPVVAFSLCDRDLGERRGGRGDGWWNGGLGSYGLS